MTSKTLHPEHMANNLSLLKELIQQKNQELIEKFDPKQPVAHLIKEKSEFIDWVLSSNWQHFFADDSEKLSLLAVGGYGREELFPHSDIDILILLSDESDEDRFQQAISDFSVLLWDIGLKPGMSVRTIKQCVETSTEDQTIMTSLMESRLIYGNRKLFAQLSEQITSDKIWPSELFFQAKMDEQNQRYLKYHETAYNLEPNIKEGPGGLRDMQIIAWVFKRHYNSATLKELIKYGFMPAEEYNDLVQARQTLWNIRYALHALTGRCEDRLLFSHQRELAELFGFKKEGVNNEVEQFMQFYFKTVVGLERLNEMLLQLFSELFIYNEKSHDAYAINFNFNAINGYIEAANDQVFENNPIALLEVFLLQQQITSIKGVRATTVRLIRKSLHLIDDEFRNNHEAQRLFIEIFHQPHGLTTVLRRMNRYGVLAAYLPAFDNIVSRMQYDLFHIYTVDVHTLFLIRNLRRFSLQKHYDELPFCNDIFRLIPKPDVLYLAGLFHDIAKGKGGDHSELGESIALQFCRQHQLPKHDSKLIGWLVRNHLLMSMTAQRKDIRDPEVIHEFAKTVNSIKRLNYLYLLTVADIRATNPSLWNSWKDTLLKDLYIQTHQALHRGLHHPIELEEKQQENKQEAERELIALGMPRENIKNTWALLSDNYFLRYSSDEIIWHTIAITCSDESELPLVLLRPSTLSGSAEVFVYAKNEDHIFSLCTATLDRLGLSILDARIITNSDDFVLNSFQVLEQKGQRIKELHRELHICNSLRETLINKVLKKQTPVGRLPPQAQVFPIKTRVNFTQDNHHNRTIMQLITTDRPGLLSQIGKIFKKHKIDLFNAKITTIGSRVEDMFYISPKNADSPIEALLQEALKKDVLDAFKD